MAVGNDFPDEMGDDGSVSPSSDVQSFVYWFLRCQANGGKSSRTEASHLKMTLFEDVKSVTWHHDEMPYGEDAAQLLRLPP